MMRRHTPAFSASVLPDPASTSLAGDAGTRGKRAYLLSVGTRGMLVIAALLAYLMGISLYAVHQKQVLLQDFERMQTAMEEEAVLSQAQLSAYQAIAALSDQGKQADRDAKLLALAGDVPGTVAAAREKRQALSEHYRAQSQSATQTMVVLGALGLLLLGLAIALFFRRMVSAVNRMGDSLDQSARDLMLERQRYFHKDKMAAIGTLAAGIAHEIGNPIAAISGVAQEMLDRRASGMGDLNGESDGHPELILAQTKRLAAITREISMFAAPSTAESQLLDLNEIVRSTSRLIRYDKRLEPITLHLELDAHLPAIQGTADQLTQLIINLLINAMDALQSVSGRVPNILIQTGADSERAWMFVNDNGCGMTEQTLSHVFEAFFTTKVVGQGTGLGLSLCYAIVKAHEGTIDIKSTPGIGTQVQVCFPLDATFNNEPSAV
jgi:signal transduction histidine kinase